MNQETILVVDDNPEMVVLIDLLLSYENFAVRTANSARDALEALSSSVPDGMLTDIQMPDVDGLELIRQVRLSPRTSGLPILAVSANAMEENIREAYAAGCDGYITKPFDTRTFAASVREQLELGRNGKTGRPKGATVSKERSLFHGGFAADCMQQIEQLLCSTDDPPRREQASRILHHCAGRAGVLGYPDITALARNLENHLAALNEQEFIDGLHRLSDLLALVPLQVGEAK